jgi:hypothetical protein
MTEKPQHTIQEALSRLSIENERYTGSYSVFAYYYNADLIPPNDPSPMFGLVIPCGEYSTRRAAEEARDKVAALTGSHCVVSCENNKPFPIQAGTSEKAISYLHDTNVSVDKLQQRINEARKRKASIQERLNTEIRERDNISSMSYLHQQMYLASFSKDRMEKLASDLKKSETAYNESMNNIRYHALHHPENIATWKEDLKSRLEERGEIRTYALITKHMDKELSEHGLQCPMDHPVQALEEPLDEAPETSDYNLGHIMGGC